MAMGVGCESMYASDPSTCEEHQHVLDKARKMLQEFNRARVKLRHRCLQ